MTPPNPPRGQGQKWPETQSKAQRRADAQRPATQTQTKSKAQRRAEAQQRAAEKRAAELRQKRMRTGVRFGAVILLIAVVAVVIVLIAGGGSSNSGNVPPQFKNPHLSLQPIPASMSSTWVQPPAGTP